eukprot:jgi/Tetstr1/432519/TSEL_021892.t1
MCYGVYRAAANAAAKTALATLRAPDTPTQDRVDALDLLDAAHRTLEAVGDADEARLTYLRRFKAKKALTPEEQAQALATFKRQATERDTDTNKARKENDKAARERREQQRREADAKNRDKNGGRTGDKTRVSFDDATPAQLKFLTAELRRCTAAGAWEKSSCAWWVSRAFFVPKPGDNQWRFIIDLRVLNTFCARKRLRMKTLMGVRHLTAKGDYMLSFDMQDGFYALGIAPSDRDYFTVNIRGTLYRLCGLPMGWSLSPYSFTTFTMTFVKHLRSPSTPAAPGNVPRSRRWLRRGRWRGARILPYVDDFLLFASSEPEALELRQCVADLLDSLGLQRNPAKGLWEPVQYGQHLGVDIDTATGYFYAPVDKPQRLARQAKQLLQRAARNARWLPVRELQSLARRAQYFFLAIPAARFCLRELHDVVGSKWGGRVRMTHQLRRDLRWLEARGFWGAADERQHITWKDLKAVRLAVESFLPHLAGRHVLLYEDNHAVCSVLAGLTSRSPAMMAELRKLWYLLDSNGVHIRARYIRSAANVWADRLSRHLDSDDWQLDLIMFAELEAMWGAHSVDRFASALNAMLPRYNAAWLDPGCEALDSLHLSDAKRRRENNYCNPP